jgi:hypothetical protein
VVITRDGKGLRKISSSVAFFQINVKLCVNERGKQKFGSHSYMNY